MQLGDRRIDRRDGRRFRKVHHPHADFGDERARGARDEVSQLGRPQRPPSAGRQRRRPARLLEARPGDGELLVDVGRVSLEA